MLKALAKIITKQTFSIVSQHILWLNYIGYIGMLQNDLCIYSYPLLFVPNLKCSTLIILIPIYWRRGSISGCKGIWHRLILCSTYLFLASLRTQFQITCHYSSSACISHLLLHNFHTQVLTNSWKIQIPHILYLMGVELRKSSKQNIFINKLKQTLLIDTYWNTMYGIIGIIHVVLWSYHIQHISHF